MLFGQSTDPRVPFTRPVQATPNFRPAALRTGFYSHLRPFAQVMLPMGATSAYYPQLNPQMGPGAAPAMLPAPAAAATAPSATNGAFGASFGAAFGGGISPYRAMRTGMFPGVRANAGNIRVGAMTVGQLVRQQTPGAYPGSNVPGGTYTP